MYNERNIVFAILQKHMKTHFQEQKQKKSSGDIFVFHFLFYVCLFATENFL